MKPTTIIFDVNGVLFKENKLKLLKKIGLKRILHYIARHRVNPIAKCLNTLQAMHDIEPIHTKHAPIIYKKRTMPQCTANWQRGFITNQDVITQLDELLQELWQSGYFMSRQEFCLIKHIVHTTMNIHYLISISKPMKRTIQLVKRLKKNGAYKLFILSNMGHEPFELLKTTYPDIFTLFDDAIISADTTYIKPEPMIFEFLLAKHQLNAEECVFIDDQDENIATARHLGMTSILFSKSSLVRKQLRQLKML